ncbi:hypothetical protein C8R45DRAFT_160914 [Mycena sanguinolenta]|nr:hypothetical protein C8R45DRAFT_160914 [Mycena sanguinolenta]
MTKLQKTRTCTKSVPNVPRRELGERTRTGSGVKLRVQHSPAEMESERLVFFLSFCARTTLIPFDSSLKLGRRDSFVASARDSRTGPSAKYAQRTRPRTAWWRDGLKNVEHRAAACTVQGLGGHRRDFWVAEWKWADDEEDLHRDTDGQLIISAAPAPAAIVFLPRTPRRAEPTFSKFRPASEAHAPRRPSHSSSRFLHPTTTSLLFASSTRLLFPESTFHHPTFTLANSHTFAKHAHAHSRSRASKGPPHEHANEHGVPLDDEASSSRIRKAGQGFNDVFLSSRTGTFCRSGLGFASLRLGTTVEALT